MLFRYKAVDEQGINKDGEIDAPNKDLAISGLQRRGFIIISIKENKKVKNGLDTAIFERVSMKEIVIFSRQIATLFEAQVSALKAFTLISTNSENPLFARKLNEITTDIQGGVSISGAMKKHPDVFSEFYVNMIKAGEETGKLNETFLYLAEYLDRQYALTNKTRNALIYPFFVIITFFVVMALMLTVVIPKLSDIIRDSGQEVPIYTKVVIGLSDFFVQYGLIFLIFLAMGFLWLWFLSRSEKGKIYVDHSRLSIPVVGNLYRKLYISRISDNLHTMLVSGIPIVRSLDITADVVSSKVYKDLLKKVAEDVKAGSSISSAFEKFPTYLPPILVQMIKVGEETGSLGNILKTLADFYKREVDDAVDTMVGLIEPVMVVVLGIAVGLLLVSVLVPIYNLAGGIQ